MFSSKATSQDKKNMQSPATPGRLSLIQAVMCEDVKEKSPQNQAIVFPLSVGKVICFTAFDPVTETTIIFHNWFFKDKADSNRKFTLKSPRWATYSSMPLRESDRGPWRVEISDQQGNILRILRFSIVD
jgi:hypothetical protein